MPKVKVPKVAYEHATLMAEALCVQYGEIRAVIQDGECVALFTTSALPKDKVELVEKSLRQPLQPQKW